VFERKPHSHHLTLASDSYPGQGADCFFSHPNFLRVSYPNHSCLFNIVSLSYAHPLSNESKCLPVAPTFCYYAIATLDYERAFLFSPSPSSPSLPFPNMTSTSNQSTQQVSTSSEQPAALTTSEAAILASSSSKDASGRQPTSTAASASELASTKISLLAALRRFADFPIPGINFIDILPIFQNPATHRALLRALELQVLEFGAKPDVVVGLDARGFLFGPQLALQLDASFIPVRKQGKLPGPCVTATYEKEYGQDFFQMQEGAIKPGQKVLVVDDIIATGKAE
jgi:adenine phosphoribosyltransferase